MAKSDTTYEGCFLDVNKINMSEAELLKSYTKEQLAHFVILLCKELEDKNFFYDWNRCSLKNELIEAKRKIKELDLCMRDKCISSDIHEEIFTLAWNCISLSSEIDELKKKLNIYKNGIIKTDRCNFTYCRYNKDFVCKDKEGRKDCIDLCLKVFCLDDKEIE